MPRSSLQTMRVGIARAEKTAKRTGDRAPVERIRRDYAAASIEDYVRRTVDSAPPLTDAQRDRIAALLRPTGGEVA